MITKKKPVQTQGIDKHKVHEFSIKLIPISTDCVYILIPICIKTPKNVHTKKFPEREECKKKQRKLQKYSRQGYFVRKSYNTLNVNYNKSMLNDSLISFKLFKDLLITHGNATALSKNV